jgi:cAMP-dependent protein kinase regulator
MSVVDGLPFAEDKKKYIVDVLDPILEEMVSDVLTTMPPVPIDFMISWLRKRSGLPASSELAGMSVAQKNRYLKDELNRAQGVMSEVVSTVNQEAKKDEESAEEDDDDCDEIPPDFIKSEASMGRARQSVSAEAYGTWNTKKAFEPPNYPKTDAQKARLGSTLQKSFMFAALEQKDLDVILMAMKECPFAAGAKVIAEGENGDFLFVIEKGTLECIKNIGGEDKVVKTVNEGDVFGELALLYNCPRAANVVAKEECVCWQLDRDTFNNIVKDSSVRRREKYDAFLQSVTLLSSIDAYERSQVSDALKAETFSKGDVIVKQDEPGDKFYIVEEGTLYADKDGNKVMDYKAGDYFGELALLKNQPRAASVTVSSESGAKVLSMSRQAFCKMLGPLQELLSRQVSAYK